MRKNAIAVGVAAAGIAAIVTIASWRALRRRESGPPRPHTIFINETSHHEHDLALKMSLVLAEKRSGIENALVLLHELPPGASIEETAQALFRKWRIGETRDGRGILYVRSEKEGEFRILVSPVLEEGIPVELRHRLEVAARTYLLSEIPQDFLSELLITMNLGTRPTESGSTEREENVPEDYYSPPHEWISTYLSGGAATRAAAGTNHPSFADFRRVVDLTSDPSIEHFRAAPDPEATLERYMESLQDGIGDPRLPLLSMGSRVFRWIAPRSRFQQKRAWSYYQTALPYRLVADARLAYAVFRSGTPNLPIVLRKGPDGNWVVDEVKQQAWFHRYEDGLDFFPKYGDLPLLSRLRELLVPNADRPIYDAWVGATPTPLPDPSTPEALDRRVAELESAVLARPKDAPAHARLAEVYLFEMGWADRSIESFEEAVAIQPGRVDWHWRLLDLYLGDSRMEKALTELDWLAERMPANRFVRDWRLQYRKMYDFEPGEF